MELYTYFTDLQPFIHLQYAYTYLHTY